MDLIIIRLSSNQEVVGLIPTRVRLWYFFHSGSNMHWTFGVYLCWDKAKLFNINSHLVFCRSGEDKNSCPRSKVVSMRSSDNTKQKEALEGRIKAMKKNILTLVWFICSFEEKKSSCLLPIRRRQNSCPRSKVVSMRSSDNTNRRRPSRARSRRWRASYW